MENRMYVMHECVLIMLPVEMSPEDKVLEPLEVPVDSCFVFRNVCKSFLLATHLYVVSRESNTHNESLRNCIPVD